MLFFSRPRRFGKSLLLDTLKDLFEGHESLFTGLAAEILWEWSKKKNEFLWSPPRLSSAGVEDNVTADYAEPI